MHNDLPQEPYHGPPILVLDGRVLRHLRSFTIEESADWFSPDPSIPARLIYVQKTLTYLRRHQTYATVYLKSLTAEYRRSGRLLYRCTSEVPDASTH